MSLDDANALLREQGAKSFAFENVGDTVSGEIINAGSRQQTSMDTNEPMFWDAERTRPRMMLTITLQTNLRDGDNDDGQRTLYLKGGNPMVAHGDGTSGLNAVRDAILRTGAKEIEIGAHLTVTHSGMGKSSGRGYNPPKLYTAEYRPPVRNVSLDELS